LLNGQLVCQQITEINYEYKKEISPFCIQKNLKREKWDKTTENNSNSRSSITRSIISGNHGGGCSGGVFGRGCYGRDWLLTSNDQKTAATMQHH